MSSSPVLTRGGPSDRSDLDIFADDEAGNVSEQSSQADRQPERDDCPSPVLVTQRHRPLVLEPWPQVLQPAGPEDVELAMGYPIDSEEDARLSGEEDEDVNVPRDVEEAEEVELQSEEEIDYNKVLSKFIVNVRGHAHLVSLIRFRFQLGRSYLCSEKASCTRCPSST